MCNHAPEIDVRSTWNRWPSHVSDNMPFASCEFQAIAKDGQVERCVSVVKQMLRKTDEEGRDPYLELLVYRNTAVTGMSYSPAQILMNRVLNSKIPILPALLEPKVVDQRPQVEHRQRRHKTVFDRGARKAWLWYHHAVSYYDLFCNIIRTCIDQLCSLLLQHNKTQHGVYMDNGTLENVLYF